MRLSGGTAVIFLFGLSFALAQSRHVQFSSDTDSDFINSAVMSKTANKREKKAASMTARGLMALRKLLSGSKKVPLNSKVYRRFEKPGDFETAMKEFYSVKPRNVKEHKDNKNFMIQFQAGRVITGNVGNRRLILRTNGPDGQPSLEVIETKFEPGPYIDQIIYKN